MAPTTADVKYAEAAIERVTAENGIDYAYRDLGRGDIPIVLLQHFRGNLDNWDPALIDALAAERRVVTFDNVGVGGTGGSTPSTFEEMAHGAIAFMDSMGFEQVDLLGFSIGSMVAQEIALIRPHGHEPPGGPGGRRTHLRETGKPGRADQLADAVGAVRGRHQLGHPEPRSAGAGDRHRLAGVRGQRR